MQNEKVDVLIVGSGPAGLMAAEVISAAGHAVLVVDQKPSVGRKLLMAGKSGLNITKDEALEQFCKAITPLSPQLKRALKGFGPSELVAWSENLGQPVFTGSSHRVFPKTMKASPLLRAWLLRLADNGVEIRTRWKWQGWDGDAHRFDTPDGPKTLNAKASVLAMGGASWSRLGSDGLWSEHIPHEAFKPANMGFTVDWSAHMERFFGQPIKPVRLSFGEHTVAGEFVLSGKGIEGGAVYNIAAHLRDGMSKDGVTLKIDLAPDRSVDDLIKRLSRPAGKNTISNHLRKSIGLTGAKLALLREVLGTDLSDLDALARHIKSLPLHLTGTRPIDEAISTAGGVPFKNLSKNLVLKNRPGVFVAGEMLDWEAPTGGYLITTCMASGRLAGSELVSWLDQNN